MKKHSARWGLLVLACLLVTACNDRRDPVKPSVGSTAGSAATVQART